MRNCRSPSGLAAWRMPHAELPPRPLSEDEFETLAGWLDACSPFDVQGTLGLFHAVAVAPSLLAPSQWLPVVLPIGVAELTQSDGATLMSLLIRLQTDVTRAIANEETLTPESDEEDACRSFAEGYTAGAELDPEWLGDAGRWAYAAPMAYLGGRLDLVSREMVAAIEGSYAPDPPRVIRAQLADMIHSTHDAFAKLQSQLQFGAGPRSARSLRIGRNESCPCGSGKKYKRCCIDVPDEPGETPLSRQ